MIHCPECDKEGFNSEHAMKIHHKLSHGFSIAREKTNCKKCGKEFEYYTEDKKGLYCENCVDNSWGNENLNFGEGESNNNWSGGQIKTDCSNCEKEITVRRANHRPHENNFCSKECESKFRSEQYSGKNNPRYVDGKSSQRNYGKGWKKARRKARSRDGYECVVCEKKKEDNERSLSVHHIKPVRKFDKPENAHFLENLVTLCAKHHQKVESGNQRI